MKRKWEPGDWALHRNNQLDSREVAEVDRTGSRVWLRLIIGDVPDCWVPAGNYANLGPR